MAWSSSTTESQPHGENFKRLPFPSQTDQDPTLSIEVVSRLDSRVGRNNAVRSFNSEISHVPSMA
jgi:hypothetical protein